MPRGQYKRTPRAASPEPIDENQLEVLGNKITQLQTELDGARRANAQLSATNLSVREQLDECHRIIGRQAVAARLTPEDSPVGHRNGAFTTERRGNSHTE